MNTGEVSLTGVLTVTMVICLKCDLLLWDMWQMTFELRNGLSQNIIHVLEQPAERERERERERKREGWIEGGREGGGIGGQLTAGCHRGLISAASLSPWSPHWRWVWHWGYRPMRFETVSWWEWAGPAASLPSS